MCERCERIKADGLKIVLASCATDDKIEFFKKAMNIADPPARYGESVIVKRALKAAGEIIRGKSFYGE